MLAIHVEALLDGQEPCPILMSPELALREAAGLAGVDSFPAAKSKLDEEIEMLLLEVPDEVELLLVEVLVLVEPEEDPVWGPAQAPEPLWVPFSRGATR